MLRPHWLRFVWVLALLSLLKLLDTAASGEDGSKISECKRKDQALFVVAKYLDIQHRREKKNARLATSDFNLCVFVSTVDSRNKQQQLQREDVVYFLLRTSYLASGESLLFKCSSI